MEKFEIILNDENDNTGEILVKLCDEEEVEIWKSLMATDSECSHVCEECNATFNSESIEPLMWTPKFPEKMPIAFNVAVLRCPFCHTGFHEEYVVYGEPFDSITDLGKRIRSGEVDGTPRCK